MTASVNLSALRRILRWLWQEYGAPKLDDEVPHLPGVRPRNVTTTREVIDRLVETDDLSLRMMILLCSDMGIRSGTAIRLCPSDFDAVRGILSFSTKMDEKLSLPVTDAVRQMIDLCNLDDSRSFVMQLFKLKNRGHVQATSKTAQDYDSIRKRFNKLRASITSKRITFHDLRRTAAVRMYELTGDLRAVQALLGHRTLIATIWYLDHDLKPVSRANLELIKRLPGPERKIA